MEKMKSRTIMFSLLIVLISNHLCPIHTSDPLAPALYIFGDSLVDNGNNNWIPNIAKANYLPYGLNFPQGPTGRFSNGKTLADLLAEYLGLPYSPAYLSREGPSSFTGINYASGAAGILRRTGSQAGILVPMDEQIESFKRTIELHLPLHLNKNDIPNHLSKSIFLISIGNNDYLISYLGSIIGRSITAAIYTPDVFAQLLIDALSKQLQRLYKLGARKIIIDDIPPLGCIPMNIDFYSQKKGECIEEINDIVKPFNERLYPMIQNLSSTLPGSFFALGHINSATTEIITNPTKYGFVDVSGSCCQRTLNLTCTAFRKPCPNPEQFFFWDGAHPTEVIYSMIAKRMISDKSLLSPYTLEDLLKL